MCNMNICSLTNVDFSPSAFFLHIYKSQGVCLLGRHWTFKCCSGAVWWAQWSSWAQRWDILLLFSHFDETYKWKVKHLVRHFGEFTFSAGCFSGRGWCSQWYVECRGDYPPPSISKPIVVPGFHDSVGSSFLSLNLHRCWFSWWCKVALLNSNSV